MAQISNHQYFLSNCKNKLNLKDKKGFKTNKNEKFSNQQDFVHFSSSKFSPSLGSEATRDSKFAFEPSTKGQEAQ